MKWRLVAIPLAVTASLIWTVGAQAAQVFNVDVPLAVTFPNPCAPGSGETIAFTGTIHVLFNETFPPDGSIHVQFEDNVHDVTGLSSTGVTYSGVGGDWFELNASPPFPFNATATDVFGLISDGATANFLVTATFHITVNADGTVTATVSNVRIACKG
jgi:hypothetical protein